VLGIWMYVGMFPGILQQRYGGPWPAAWLQDLPPLDLDEDGDGAEQLAGPAGQQALDGLTEVEMQPVVPEHLDH
jgi:hypothetical protein